MRFDGRILMTKASKMKTLKNGCKLEMVKKLLVNDYLMGFERYLFCLKMKNSRPLNPFNQMLIHPL